MGRISRRKRVSEKMVLRSLGERTLSPDGGGDFKGDKYIRGGRTDLEFVGKKYDGSAG